MYKGYLEYGGTEIANALRVVDYVRKNAPHIPLKVDRDKHLRLNEALAEEEYDSPAADNAPWIDPADPSTRRFLGVYPLDITGVDASTRSAATVESIGNGGVTGRVRHGSKAIRVTAMLVAEDALALEAGATWLSRALDSDDCGSAGGNCTGAPLCFYAAKPEVCDEWEPTYQAGYGRPISVTEMSSPLILRDGGDSIFKGRLDRDTTSSREGVVVEWGTVLRDNTNVWDEHYGPVMLRRTNLMLDPNFDGGGAGWSPVTFPGAGGSDGGAYAQVDVPTIELGDLVATNLAFDPSFEATLGPDVHRTNLDPNPAKVGGGAWEPDNLPAGAPEYLTDGGPSELPFDTYARFTMTSDDTELNGGIRFGLDAPVIGAFYAASQWIRLDEEQVIKVRWAAINGGASGETTNVVVPADTWTRVGIVTAAIPAGTTQVRFTIETPVGGGGHMWVTGNTFDHTGALIEERRFIDEFFYGGMADTADAVYDFTGTVNGSTSTIKRYRAIGSVVGSTRDSFRHSGAMREGAYGQRVVALSTTAASVQMSSQNPAVGSTATVMMWAYSHNREVSVTPRIRGGNGAPVAVPQGVWTKVAATVTVGGASNTSTGVTIAGAQIGDLIDFDMFTMVDGVYTGDPFTGSTPASGGHAYQWSGAANASTALKYETIAAEYAIDSPAFAPPSGDFITSFALRSVADSSVVVQLLNDDTDAVMAEALLSPDEEWDRYSFGGFGGIPVRLHFVGDAPFDIDEVLAEIGRIELPYFDGNSPWQEAAAGYIVGGMATPEYSVGWAAQPFTSPSIMEWLGQMTIGVPFGADFGLQSGACDVWPRIDVLQGELSGGFADFALRTKVPTARQVQPYERTLFDVTCVSGPTPLRELEFDNGTRMRVVEFILVAGKPFIFGSPTNVIYPAYGSQLGTVPWTDPVCPSTEVEIISDPLCPPPPAPPRPPAIAASCVPPETTWERHWFNIPAELISGWSEMVPQISVRADVAPVRHFRVRFYPNPFDRTPEEIDPCSWCSEYVLSYLPPNTDAVIDAALERSTASVNAGPSQSIDTLVVSTGGEPLEWSSMSCGISYLMAVDFPTGSEDQVKFGLDIMRRL